MKGKIKIKFEYHKDEPNSFSHIVDVNGVTSIHIVTAIGDLLDVLKEHTPIEEQKIVIKMLNKIFDIKNTFDKPITIVPQGNA